VLSGCRRMNSRTSRRLQLSPNLRRQEVAFPTKEPAGTLVVDTPEHLPLLRAGVTRASNGAYTRQLSRLYRALFTAEALAPRWLTSGFEGGHGMLRLFVLGLALSQQSPGAFLLREDRLQSCLRELQLRLRLFQSLGLRSLRGPCPIDLIDCDKLLTEQRLNPIQVVARIRPLRSCAAYALLGVRYVGPCLIDRGSRSVHVSFRALNIRLGN